MVRDCDGPPYTPDMSEPLTSEQVKHVAKLARLRLPADAVEGYRRELSNILQYVEKLQKIDVEGVEPMAHPLPITNRLGEDEVTEPMPREALLRNAPAVEGAFLAVPKVLDGEGGGA